MNTLLFRAVTVNNRKHPLNLGLLYAYCPAAAYWWRAGVEIKFPFDPVWQAVEDYTAQPPRTLREYLEQYGLSSLIDDARKYIEQVTTARQRLPHITAPELLPTFPGGKLPLRKRFGIREALERIGGAAGFFAYVRTWAFLIPDWLAAIPFEGIRLKTSYVRVRFGGLRAPYRLPVWEFVLTSGNGGNATPVVLGVPPNNFAALASLYLMAQSEGEHAWKHAPQVWQLFLNGTASPVDPMTPAEDAGRALLALAARARNDEHPLPWASLVSPAQCEHCVFRSMCFDERARAWTPQASAFVKAEAVV